MCFQVSVPFWDSTWKGICLKNRIDSAEPAIIQFRNIIGKLIPVRNSTIDWVKRCLHLCIIGNGHQGIRTIINHADGLIFTLSWMIQNATHIGIRERGIISQIILSHQILRQQDGKQCPIFRRICPIAIYIGLILAEFVGNHRIISAHCRQGNLFRIGDRKKHHQKNDKGC